VPDFFLENSWDSMQNQLKQTMRSHHEPNKYKKYKIKKNQYCNSQSLWIYGHSIFFPPTGIALSLSLLVSFKFIIIISGNKRCYSSYLLFACSNFFLFCFLSWREISCLQSFFILHLKWFILFFYFLYFLKVGIFWIYYIYIYIYIYI
jgi:hypothetical protein